MKKKLSYKILKIAKKNYTSKKLKISVKKKKTNVLIQNALKFLIPFGYDEFTSMF